MLIFRVDNRLIHGQIIEGWLPYMGAQHVLVVSDAMANDALYLQIISLAVPKRVNLHVVEIVHVWHVIQKLGSEKVLVLFENCQDLQKVIFSPFAPNLVQEIAFINIGNLHHEQGKKIILPHISLSVQECELLKMLAENFTLDFRCIPSEKNRGIHELCL